ncbi:MAG: FAD synthetase family protein [Clostridiales bacterium]|nr:FAD synthetase family protein [Clostridiales bacterium]
MRIYPVEELAGSLDTPSVVCLGVFDGVHLGHRALIDAALSQARQLGITAMVHTYDPLPIQVIQPERRVPVLSPLPERLALIEQAGIQQAAVSRFDHSLQHERGADFFTRVLLGKLNARHLVVGFNHRFGFHGDTDVDRLDQLCRQAGVGLTVIAPIRNAQGLLVSSSAIRAAILLDDLELAESMLGRPPDAAMIRRLQEQNHTGARSTITEG